MREVARSRRGATPLLASRRGRGRRLRASDRLVPLGASAARRPRAPSTGPRSSTRARRRRRPRHATGEAVPDGGVRSVAVQEERDIDVPGARVMRGGRPDRERVRVDHEVALLLPARAEPLQRADEVLADQPEPISVRGHRCARILAAPVSGRQSVPTSSSSVEDRHSFG